MKQIMSGDAGVIKLVGSSAMKDNTTYRWSDFVLPLEHGNRQYLFNNLTKRCYQLEQEQKLSHKAVFTTEQIKENAELSLLVKDWFLVPDDKDEAKFYEQTISLVRMFKDSKRTKGYTSFIILPTTACNARCVYCFEQGMKYVTMTDGDVEQTIRFIIEHATPNRKIRLNWFGGEPLVGEKIIDRITDALREAGIDFKSKIVTNGSLITPEIIDKMKNRWNIYSMQITLDGIEEEYNRRKNYYFNYESAYWHVLSRIKLVNESGLALCIRVNIDEQNMNGVMQMIEDIRPFIKYKETIIFDLVPLFEAQSRESGIVVWEELFQLMDKIEEAGFRVVPHVGISQLRLHHCMADNPGSAVTISPDGRLYNCENIDAYDSLGTISEGITNRELYRAFAAIEKTQDDCKGCVSLPDCTSFSHCPNPKLHCKYYKRRYLERELHKKLDNLSESIPEEMTEEC